jgi:hypothetical protein
LKNEGNNGRDRKVSKQNTEKKSQMLLGHPLTLGAHQHDEHVHPKLLAKSMKKRKWNQKGLP